MLERKVREHDERQQAVLQQYTQRQWLVISQEFDNKMQQLMSDNERRLKDILKIQDERFLQGMNKKADKDEVYMHIAAVIPKSDFQDV